MSYEVIRRSLAVHGRLAVGQTGFVILTGAGAPTDGASGTGVNEAGPGSFYIDTTNAAWYINGGTKAVPAWEPAGSGGSLGALVEIRNETGGTLNAGTPVYISGYDATNDKWLVTKADADASGRIAQYFITASLATATNGLASKTYRGTMNGTGDAALDLAGLTVGDPLYLSTTAGQVVTAASIPTGADDQIQIIGRVAVVATDIAEGIIVDAIKVGSNELVADSVQAAALGVTAGTVLASRAVVVDANKDISSFRNIGYTGNLSRSTAVVAAAGAGADATDATAMTADYNAVTGADGTKGVALPAAADDLVIEVVNTSATATLKVWPVSAGNDGINSLGANAAFILAPASSAKFIASSATQWYAEVRAASRTVFVDLMERLKGADGADLALSETAGDFFRNIGTNQWLVDGEATINETEASVGWASFVLPSDYIDGGAVSIVVSAMVILAGDAANDATSTIDVEVFEQSKSAGTVGADICATAAQTLATAGADYTFTVTPTGLVAGDTLNVKLTTSVVETAGGTGAANSRIAKFGASIAALG